VNVVGLAGRDELGTESGSSHQIFDGTLSSLDVEDLTYAEVEMRKRLAFSLEYYKRNVPGFESVRLLSFGPQLSVRESRRIKGAYTVTQDDVNQKSSFSDSIGKAGFASRDCSGAIEVPYSTLLPNRVDRLLTAGRCISVDHWTQRFLRLIVPAMMTGQAAGNAAALSVKKGAKPKHLDPGHLRQELSANGVIL